MQLSTPKNTNSLPAWKGLVMLMILLAGVGFWWGSYSLKTTPEGVEPKDQIDFKRLAGRWHEIGRLENEVEHGFGQALLMVGLTSKNRFSISLVDPGKSASWQAEANFNGDANLGSVFINCFGWLACGYHIIAFDSKSYDWILVSGHNFKQLWIFSRASWMDKSQLKRLIDQVDELGYDSSDLLIHNLIPETPQLAPEGSSSSGMSPSTVIPVIAPPETPANLPPEPLHIPEVPAKIPSAPQVIPVTPTDIPQIGKVPYIPPPEEMSAPEVK